MWVVYGLVLIVMAPYAVIALAGIATWTVQTVGGAREGSEPQVSRADGVEEGRREGHVPPGDSDEVG